MDEPEGSEVENGDVNTDSFELLDLFLEVSVLGMVLLVFGTCSDTLGQLHPGLGYLYGLVDL